jgi:pimeloyl-ACP methyl ester carboxylesterase
MTLPDHVLFLPGASGNVDFWRPVAARLPLAGRTVRHLGWPGFGPTPADPAVRSLADLAARVEAMLDRPTALVALLPWGDADPWSPVAAGEWLAAAMPRAELHVMAGGAHTFAMDSHAREVAARIEAWSSA